MALVASAQDEGKSVQEGLTDKEFRKLVFETRNEINVDLSLIQKPSKLEVE